MANAMHLDLSLYKEEKITSAVALPVDMYSDLAPEYKDSAQAVFDMQLGTIIRKGGFRLGPVQETVTSNDDPEYPSIRYELAVSLLIKL